MHRQARMPRAMIIELQYITMEPEYIAMGFIYLTSSSGIAVAK
jgi:hypothetical protein